MSEREWIRQNRAGIDRVIREACPNIGRINDRERALWIQNHEGLYHAQRRGWPLH